MSSYLEGQVHQLVNRLEAEGFTPEDITNFGQSKAILVGLRGVLRGTHEIKLVTKLEEEKPKPERIRVINETTILVNLDAPPNLPFNGAKIDFQSGSGWIQIEKRADGLYADDRKVIMYLSEHQKGKKVLRGHELQEELSGKLVLHPNIMDALCEYPHLIPEGWKVDEEGNTRYIFFWAVIFRHADGSLYVRCLCFLDGRWRRHCRWLDGGWLFQHPAALLASQP